MPDLTVQGENPRLAELVSALSLATDLAAGMPMESTLRATLLSVHVGEVLGLTTAELADVYYTALLRFLGCTSHASLAAEIFGDDLAGNAALLPIDQGRPAEVLGFLLRRVGAGRPTLERLRMIATALVRMPAENPEVLAGDCEAARLLAEMLGCSMGVREALGQIYARWDGRGIPAGLRGEAIALPARIVQAAAPAIVLFDLGGSDLVAAAARERAGKALDPAVADCLVRHGARLLPEIKAAPAWETVLAAEPGARPVMAGTRLGDACRAIGVFADLKSPYLLGHSDGVAALAGAAAEQLGLPAGDVAGVRRAACLLDAGRTGVSSAIWNKSGPLSAGEWEQVRLHPYLTERILARSPALARLGAIAGLHHERLDGSGYHRGAPAALLPLPARILAAADAFRAMTSNRAHRPALSPEAAADELRREVRQGRMDGVAVDAVIAAAGYGRRTVRRFWPNGLTDREVSVLRLLARGMSNRAMSAELGISVKTAGHHVQHIYNKIGVGTRAGATLYALQNGLLEHAESP